MQRILVSAFNHLVYEHLIGLLFIHEEVLASDDNKLLIIIRGHHRYDFISFSSGRCFQRDFNQWTSNLLVGSKVINIDLIDIAHQEGVDGFHRKTKGSFQILIHYLDTVIVSVLSRPYIKRSLIGLVGDAILNLVSKQHLSASHEILDHIFSGGYERFWIYQVDEDVFISCDLNSLVTFDPVNRVSSVRQGFIIFPFCFKSEWICNLFEEQDLARGAYDKGSFIDEIHFTEFSFMYLLKSIWVLLSFILSMLYFLNWHIEPLPLSIERVYFIFFTAVEAFVWEILMVIFHLNCLVTSDGLCNIVVYKHVVHAWSAVIQINIE